LPVPIPSFVSGLDNRTFGALGGIRTPDPQIRSFVFAIFERIAYPST
jgi:hypothetical protein